MDPSGKIRCLQSTLATYIDFLNQLYFVEVQGDIAFGTAGWVRIYGCATMESGEAIYSQVGLRCFEKIYLFSIPLITSLVFSSNRI